MLRAPLKYYRLPASDYAAPPPLSYKPPNSTVLHALLGSLPSHSPHQSDSLNKTSAHRTSSSSSLDSGAGSFSDTSHGGTGLALEPGYGSDEELQSLESPLELLAGLVGRVQSLGPSVTLQPGEVREAQIKAAVGRRLAYRRKGVQMVQEVWRVEGGSSQAVGHPEGLNSVDSL